MDLPTRFTKAVGFALLPLFLVASVLCACGPASAAESPAKPGHSCCPEGQPGPSRGKSCPGEHRTDCNHCGQGQMTAGELPPLPLPMVASVAWVPAPTSCTELLQGHVAVTPHAQPSFRSPPGQIFAQNCSFLL